MKDVCRSLRYDNFTMFFTERLSMEAKCAMKLSITDPTKISGTLRKRYNGRLWKMQMWSDSYKSVPVLNNGALTLPAVVLLII